MRSRRHPHNRYCYALAAAALIITACGDDGPAGPSEDFDIVGEWSFRVTDAATSGASCSVNNITLTFTRSAGVVSGHRQSTGAGNVTCTINGSNSTSNYVTDEGIDNLSLDDEEIGFTFATPAGAWQMDGTVDNDDTMSGEATIHIPTNVGSLQLHGSWRATRD